MCARRDQKYEMVPSGGYAPVVLNENGITTSMAKVRLWPGAGLAASLSPFEIPQTLPHRTPCRTVFLPQAGLYHSAPVP